MAQRPGLIALTTLALAALPLCASASVFGSNIIVNGDAEAAAGAPNDSSTVATPGFVVVGAFTPVVYNAPGGFPVTGDPGVAAGGANFFSGGPSNGSSSASQVIDLSSGASTIDLGGVGFDLSAYLGGFASQNDNAVLTISFLDAVSAVLGGAALGPVTAADRGSQTGLLFRSTSGFVPIGARSVNVNLQMTRTEGSYNDGYADNLSLILRGQDVGGGVPEPSAWALMLLGFGGLGAAMRRRRTAAA
jgi:hypothetical protein